MGKLTIAFITALAFISSPSGAQINKNNKDEIKVFMDCNAWCDMDFVKTEINYVDFVPDRFVANVYILITSQPTGSGGNEISLYFTGQEHFKGMQDTLKFYRTSVGTDAEYRENLVRYLKLGLTRFIAHTSLAQKMNISAAVSKNETAMNAPVNKKDKWNSWVFTIGGSANINSDDYSKSNSFSGRLSANKVTEKLKISLNAGISKNVRTIDFNGEKSKFTNNNSNFNSTVVGSINKHWSVGGFTELSHSTYSNYDMNIALQPAVEYSFFPYKDAVKKSVTLFYRAGPAFSKYIDSGYYDKPDHLLFQQYLSFNVGIIQKWGNFNMNASWENYLNSFTLADTKIKGRNINTFSIGGNIEYRIAKGLSLYMYSNANFTKGIYPNIPRSFFSRDDLLTNTRQYPTQKGLYTNFGINYRFGSIYNNVVNPRFSRNIF